jgi:hypothetical protein
MALVRRDWFDEALTVFEFLNDRTDPEVAAELDHWRKLERESGYEGGEGGEGGEPRRRRRRRRGGRRRRGAGSGGMALDGESGIELVARGQD